MTVINTCRERNIEDVGVGTRIIAQPSAQELVGDTIVPTSARRRENQPIELLVDGITDGVSGFAVHLRDWVRHLVRYGVKVSIPSHRNSEYPEIVKLHGTKVEHPLKLYFLPGGGFPPKNPVDMFTIGYTVFETNEFPEYFRDNAENVDLLWTSNSFNYDRYVEVGIPREKIEIFSEGVDTELFNPMVPPLLKNKKDKFVMGNVCGWSERKGISVLLNAYLKEFEREENTILFISGGWYAKDHAIAEVESIKKGIRKANFPEVILDWTDRSDWEMPALFNSFDAMCYPTKGEGFCRPIAEAAACEVPVITTDAPPMNEIITEYTGYLIDVEKVAPEPRCDWICDFYRGADFFHPSEEHLRALMREVFAHPEEAKAKAVKGREGIKKKHNTALIIENVVKRLTEIG